jgi:hypothetical protein
MPADVEDVDAEHIRAFILAEEKRTSAASAAVHFRNLRVYFGWLDSEGERANPNPMTRVEGPKVTKKAKAFFTDDELTRLLKTCQGASFTDRRDTAILRVLMDTGMRVSGLAGLRCRPASTRPRYRCSRRVVSAEAAQAGYLVWLVPAPSARPGASGGSCCCPHGHERVIVSDDLVQLGGGGTGASTASTVLAPLPPGPGIAPCLG